MNYFSGFCLKDEQKLFTEYLEYGEFVVAGFSYGAQKALDFALSTSKRVDKLQLLSPAFFKFNQKLIDINLSAFRKDKTLYIKNFLTKAGFKCEKNLCKECVYVDCSCDEYQLKEMFSFKWDKIENLKDVKIEVFLGEYDKIISLKDAYEFFSVYAEVYFFKKSNHFLRREIGR